VCVCVCESNYGVGFWHASQTHRGCTFWCDKRPRPTKKAKTEDSSHEEESEPNAPEGSCGMKMRLKRVGAGYRFNEGSSHLIHTHDVYSQWHLIVDPTKRPPVVEDIGDVVQPYVNGIIEQCTTDAEKLLVFAHLRRLAHILEA
jgi:hypothetical protein